jgi:hypothetical protein
LGGGGTYSYKFDISSVPQNATDNSGEITQATIFYNNSSATNNLLYSKYIENTESRFYYIRGKKADSDTSSIIINNFSMTVATLSKI